MDCNCIEFDNPNVKEVTIMREGDTPITIYRESDGSFSVGTIRGIDFCPCCGNLLGGADYEPTVIKVVRTEKFPYNNLLIINGVGIPHQPLGKQDHKEKILQKFLINDRTLKRMFPEATFNYPNRN